MDYMFFSSLQHSEHIVIVVSYDIACQWSVNLWERMKTYPHWMQTDHNGKSFHFLVPKFHLPAHVMSCQTVFSFNFNRFVGRTDGEAPERGWSRINPIATSTAEMGPGHRRDTLDDHFGDGNWKKTTLMAISLLRKIKTAVAERNDHKFLHHQFVLGLPEASVEKWEQELCRWEEDHANPNPFEKRFKTITQDAVRKRLAVEEAKQMAAGTAYVLHEDISASRLITMGLDFEEQQRQLAVDLSTLGPHSTDEQKTKLQVRSNVLRRKISSWITIQHLYMPALHLLRSREDHTLPPDQEERISDVKLYLPSATVGSKVMCDIRLCQVEWDLRQAQAQDALHELRDNLRLRSHVYQDKDRFQQGQRKNTRSRGLANRLEGKVNAAAAKYRAARRAISMLALPLSQVGWERSFPVLNDSDIKGLTDSSTPEYIKELRKLSKASRPSKGRKDKPLRTSEGHRDITWIWKQLGTLDNTDELLQDDLRIEFCKSKARADRWAEEVELLQEEMKRVKLFFEKRAQNWTSHAERVGTGILAADPAMAEGLRAFANEQASQFRSMRARCDHLWRYVAAYVALEEGEVVPMEVQVDVTNTITTK